MTDSNTRRILALDRFDAFIFDLDGVITRTAKLHAAAWKKMFDGYLARHTSGANTFIPFNADSDYRRYVDGKPRYDGVRSFLESRKIHLPFGDPSDSPGTETICGLGNLKDEIYHAALQSDGVEVYESSVQLLRRLRGSDTRTAVVSSSRNCLDVLKAARIVDLFDARVDGIELERLNMQGKPAPDMFIEASRRLDVPPRRCVGVEDALAGVAAAKSAGFGCVVGVDRAHQAQALSRHGADIVVDDLGELRIISKATSSKSITQLPSALDHLDELAPADGRTPALFLDYDGTLTPIVARPEDATLGESMRATLRRLAQLAPVAIISGRDLADVRALVGLEGLWYAGSHGFEIASVTGKRTEYEAGRDFLPALDSAEQSLREALANTRGCLVERKHFSIATHYRLVSPEAVESVKQTVNKVRQQHSKLRLKHGKKVLELQPDVEWDKGEALRWMMQVQSLDAMHFVPVYVGDDVTDEDAFRELAEDGIGIVVAEDNGKTRARYRLRDPDAVEDFLSKLAKRLVESRQ